jgi:hypothetical protein
MSRQPRDSSLANEQTVRALLADAYSDLRMGNCSFCAGKGKLAQLDTFCPKCKGLGRLITKTTDERGE